MGERWEQLVDGVYPRLERHGEIEIAAAVQHAGTGSVELGGDLGAEAGLAGARLTADQHDASWSVLGVRPRLTNARDGVVPPDERVRRGHCECQRERGWHTGSPGLVSGLGADPADGVGVDWIGETLQIECADVFVTIPGTVSGQQSDDVADEDLSTLRGRLQASGDDDRQSEAVVVFPRHVAGGDSDAHRKGRCRAGDLFLKGDGSVHGLGGGAERCHHTVAPRFDHPTTVSGDDLAELALVLDEQPVGAVLAEARAQVRRPDDVREQDRRRCGASLCHVRRALQDHWSDLTIGPLRRCWLETFGQRPILVMTPGVLAAYVHR